jgi:hypothetical protein
MTFRPEHLPRVAAWTGDGDGADAITSFIAHEVGASATVALTTLFWPRFVEVDGAVLMEGAFTRKGLREWQATLGSDVRAIEGVVNHLHLWDAFERRDDPVPDDALLYLADVLAQTWRAALRAQFPDRAFEVTVESGPEEYGPTLYATSARPDGPEGRR